MHSVGKKKSFLIFFSPARQEELNSLIEGIKDEQNENIKLSE